MIADTLPTYPLRKENAMASKEEKQLVKKIIKDFGKNWGKGVGPERVAAVARHKYKASMTADKVRAAMKELGIEDPTKPIRLSSSPRRGIENDR